jgi:multidrug resistance efflux pump
MNEDLGDVRDPALGARSLLMSCKPSGDGLGNGMDNQRTHYEVPVEGYRADSGARPAQRSDEDTDPQASYRVPQYYRTPQRPPRDHQPPPRQPYPSRPYQMQQPYQAQQQPYQTQQPHQAPSQQQYQALAPRAYPSPQVSRPFSLLSPGTQSVSPRTAGRLTDTPQTGSLTEQPERPYWIRRPRTWPQRIGGILIAGACVVSAAWYVPRVISDDRQLLTGTVTSSGVIALNFTDSGQISKVDVRLNQLVRKGQVLAFEYDPNADTVVAADKETISAEQAKIAELRAAGAADPAAVPADSAQLAADKAELAVDEAQLATDRMKIAATEIIAPADGTVVAANGQPGETVTSVGIRDYTTDSGRTSASQRPPFSLLPEGPQSVRTAAGGGSALPVIALRVSTSWQVVALIPEGSVSAVRPGMAVRISVPAVHIADMRGQVDEVLPTPVPTTQGIFYQAVVAITGHTASLPLSGMAADVQLGS